MNPALVLSKILNLIETSSASGTITDRDRTEFETTIWYLASRSGLYIDLDRILTIQGRHSADEPPRIPLATRPSE